MNTPDDKNPIPADEIELKRWRPQPESDVELEPHAVRAASDGKSFQKKHGHEHEAPPAPVDAEHQAPHAKPAETPLDPETKHDHLADKHAEDRVAAEDRQDALVDEGLDETFPASDPVSVKHIT